MDISIIIPAYNRANLLRLTLKSLSYAIQDLQVEILVVDDGSEPTLESLFRREELGKLPVKFLYQQNNGSIAARLHGLQNSIGEFILFLDSDDLVHPDKLIQQINQMRLLEADISYTDTATAIVKEKYDEIEIEPEQRLPEVDNEIDLFLKSPIAPHNLVYRRTYVKPYLENPIIPADKRFAHVGDIWIYYNLVPFPAKIAKVEGFYTIYSQHKEERCSGYWERAGIASLGLVLTFLKNLPQSSSTNVLRQAVGEGAFVSWRKLPNSFNRDFEELTIKIWRESPKGEMRKLGGKNFQRLARILGPEKAGWVLRKLQRPHYKKIRTVDDFELKTLMNGLLLHDF